MEGVRAALARSADGILDTLVAYKVKFELLVGLRRPPTNFELMVALIQNHVTTCTLTIAVMLLLLLVYCCFDWADDDEESSMISKGTQTSQKATRPKELKAKSSRRKLSNPFSFSSLTVDDYKKLETENQQLKNSISGFERRIKELEERTFGKSTCCERSRIVAREKSTEVQDLRNQIRQMETYVSLKTIHQQLGTASKSTTIEKMLDDIRPWSYKTNVQLIQQLEGDLTVYRQQTDMLAEEINALNRLRDNAVNSLFVELNARREAEISLTQVQRDLDAHVRKLTRAYEEKEQISQQNIYLKRYINDLRRRLDLA